MDRPDLKLERVRTRTTEDLLIFLDNDLEYLRGIADTIEHEQMHSKVVDMSRKIRVLGERLEIQ